MKDKDSTAEVAASKTDAQRASEGGCSLDPIPLPNGLKFYPASRQMLPQAKLVLKEIFKRNRYYRPDFEIHPDDTVVDIGANVGMFALWAAPQAVNGRVIAVEPTGAIECLQQNVRHNGLQNVQCLKAAVGQENGEMEFVEYPGFSLVTHRAGFRLTLRNRCWIRLFRSRPVRSRVACVSLKRVIDDFRLDTVNFLKIDCEGGEYDIVRGLPPAYWERIERVAMEFHELAPEQDHRELVELLDSQGFRVEVRKPFFEYLFYRTGAIWAHRSPA